MFSTFVLWILVLAACESEFGRSRPLVFLFGLPMCFEVRRGMFSYTIGEQERLDRKDRKSRKRLLWGDERTGNTRNGPDRKGGQRSS